MNRIALTCTLAVLTALTGLECAAQTASEDAAPIISSPQTARFNAVPFLPPCMRVAVVQGDPRKGASVQLARIAPGCFIPPHWHTANTRLIFVSGYGTHRVKGEALRTLHAGDYVYLPARKIHSFRCSSGCVVYNLQDEADVVHWIDARGRDITPARAFHIH